MTEPVTTTITAIGIVDTAVKIGLGALISGVATYYLTKLNHSQEQRKEIQRRMALSIEKACEEFDKYNAELSTYGGKLDGMIRAGLGGKISREIFETHLGALDDRLMAARTSWSIAKSRCAIIGVTAAVDALDKLSEVENEIRLMVVFQLTLLTEEQLDGIRKRVSETRAEFYDCMRAVYCDLQR